MYEIEVGTFLKHAKGGCYQVIALCQDSETLEEMVCYRKVHDTGEFVEPPSVWVRPLRAFYDRIETKYYHGMRFELWTPLECSGVDES